jgi:hypothetical protein
LLDLVAVVGNTGVLEVLQLGPWATTFGRMDVAMSRENITKAPITTASLQGTGIE